MKDISIKDKELLLKDLCARLPYGVKVLNMAEGENEVCELDSIMTSRKHKDNIFVSLTLPDDLVMTGIEMIKPYLRPMSSMTEEEKEELKTKCIHTETEEDWEGVRGDVWGILILYKYDTRRWDNHIWPSTISMDAIDWLNAHHFDYRGLIEKGLAIGVTEENNPYTDN